MTFNNTFDLINDDLEILEIKENFSKDKCFIWNREDQTICYSKFVLDENSKTVILCNVTFYTSSKTGKYLPRLIFKKVDKDGNVKSLDSKKDIIIGFNDSNKALIFWKLIGFLNKYKELVDLGEFEESFKVAPKAAYWLEFETHSQKEKIEALKELVINANLDEDGIKSIVFESRKKQIKTFLHLIKNIQHEGGRSIDLYQKHYNLRGEEAVWHHFLKQHDWILGLNIDIKFIRDFYDEQKIGVENSKGRNSPQVDLLGISNYTTLIELKHHKTRIFKEFKTNKSRSNTWDFSVDFIEGISQCLSQKSSHEKNAENKNIVNDSGERLDTNLHKTIDPTVVFIIGNRKTEFPHDNKDFNHVKSETLERFRRNNRNVDIITFDELFERAYHIVLSDKIPMGWFEDNTFEIDLS